MIVDVNNLKKYLIDRLDEASTYRGLVLVGTAIGIKVEPEEAEAVVAVGLGLSGIAGALFPDKNK